jgi:hypothetical protein
MSPFACSCIAFVCGFKRVVSRLAREGARDSIMQMGQSGESMGLEWTGIHIHASKTAISSKSFILQRIANHAGCFSPLQIRNKPHEETTNVYSLLCLLAWGQAVVIVKSSAFSVQIIVSFNPFKTSALIIFS